MSAKTLARLALLVALVFAVGHCGWVSKKFGKKKPEKPPDKLAQEGIEKLKKKKYDDAIESFVRIRDRYPYSDQARLAQIKLADSYFYKRKYDEALSAYKEFEKLHPTNKAIPYIIYRQGLCYYRQKSTIDRDQRFTAKALAEFKRLKQKYPKSEYVPKAEKYMARCRRDLMDHEFYVAEFYFRTKRYESALDRFKALAQDYPDFPKKAKVKSYIAESEKKVAEKGKKTPKGFLYYATYIFDAKW